MCSPFLLFESPKLGDKTASFTTLLFKACLLFSPVSTSIVSLLLLPSPGFFETSSRNFKKTKIFVRSSYRVFLIQRNLLRESIYMERVKTCALFLRAQLGGGKFSFFYKKGVCIYLFIYLLTPPTLLFN